MQKRRLGTILILLGALLLAGALGLLGYNQWDNGRAQKAAAQVHLMTAQLVQALPLQESQGCLQSIDTGQVGGAGLQTVREVGGQIFAVRGASGTPGQQRGQLLGQAVPQQHSADTGGAQQSLVSRYSQGGELKRFKVYGIVSGRLCGVQQKRNAPAGTDFPHRRGVLHAAADVGAVGHD